MAKAQFPEARLVRAGASRRELLKLGAEWTAASEEERAEMAAWVEQVSDSDIRTRLDEWRRGVGDSDAGAGFDDGIDPDAGEDATPDGSEEGNTGEDDDADKSGDGESDGEGDPGGSDDRATIIEAALQTGKTAAAHAEAHPEDVPDLIAAEEAGRARKTVLAALREHLPEA